MSRFYPSYKNKMGLLSYFISVFSCVYRKSPNTLTANNESNAMLEKGKNPMLVAAQVSNKSMSSYVSASFTHSAHAPMTYDQNLPCGSARDGSFWIGTNILLKLIELVAKEWQLK